MKKKHSKQNEVREGTPNRAERHHGSTTQGGSNFGQGSLQLGKDANRQGSEGNSGSDYRNEQKWNNEALRKEDMKQQKTK
ncbi:hypothetical protein [Puia sp.]|jgi:hypothetical protein|uniref:hypothetical protein n=1 Tax=Puia sp. TaxID=2045100 RepID=UPI002F429F93